jgi:hypothetical protein
MNAEGFGIQVLTGQLIWVTLIPGGNYVEDNNEVRSQLFCTTLPANPQEEMKRRIRGCKRGSVLTKFGEVSNLASWCSSSSRSTAQS